MKKYFYIGLGFMLATAVGMVLLNPALAAQFLSPPITATGTSSAPILNLTNKGSGSAIQAQSDRNTIQSTSQKANGLVAITKLQGSPTNNAAGVLGLDFTAGTFNQAGNFLMARQLS